MTSGQRFCPNCLKEAAAPNGICEHCGFDIGHYVALPHHLVPGTLIKQRYQVGRVLGEGGFGITYVGRDTVLGLKIAIKEFYMAGYVNRNHDASLMVFATLGTHQDTFNRNKEKFLSEARVLARFYEEPGIVGVRDFCEENGTAYIIMDFLDGVNLKDYLDQRGRLSPTEAVRLLMPVMRSLRHVHADGIIHRDISPDNIMVMHDGSTKLLDFGAAREVSKTDIKSLSVILKPGYAPEEQYRSKGHQGPWTDVYALAATLYRCIVGVAPDDSMERMYRDQLPAPAETEAACPIAISNVIMKALAVRQPDRYQTLDEFLADLEKALKNPEDATIAPDNRQTAQEGSRPAAGGGSSHTVLADAPTDHTVLADAPVEIATPGAVAVEQPAPQPSKAEENQPAVPQAAPAPQAAPQAEQSAPEPAQEQEPEQPAPAAVPAPADPWANRPAASTNPQERTRTEQRQPAPGAAPSGPAAKAQAPAQPKKGGVPLVPIIAGGVAAVLVIVAAIALIPRGDSVPTGGTSSAVSNSPASSSTSSEAPASSTTSDEGSTTESNAVSAITGEITLTDTVEGGEDTQVYRSFVLNSVQMELPAALSSFLDQGWVLEDESLEGTQLTPGEELSGEKLINEYGSIQVDIENQAQVVQPIEDCTVTSLTVTHLDLNDNYLDEVGNTFRMGGDVGMGGSLSQALDLYPGSAIDEFGDLKYDTDDVYLMVSEYDGDINFFTLSVRHLIPKWLDVNAHVAGEPAAYSDMAFMRQYGLEGFSYTIDGVEYTAPLTVQQFVDNGWTLERGPELLPGMSGTTYYLRKDVRTTIQLAVINYTQDAIDPMYGLAYGFRAGTEDASGVNLVDPGAQASYQGTKIVAIGDSKSDVDAAAQAAGLTATPTDDGTATIYTAGENALLGVAVSWDDTGCANAIGVGYLADAPGFSAYSYEK